MSARITIRRLFLIVTVAPFPMTVDPKTLAALYQRNVACNTRNLVWSHLRIYRRPIFPESGSSSSSKSALTVKKGNRFSGLLIFFMQFYMGL